MAGIPAVGLVEMSAEQYHADPCAIPSLSSHCANMIVSQSPLHAWHDHPRLGRGKREAPSEPKLRGTLAHELLLHTPDEMAQRIVMVQADNYRTKAAQTKRDDAHAAGKVPVLERELESATAVCGKVRARMIEHGIRLSGASELAAFWQEVASDGTVVQCRGMFDHLIRSEGRIYDIKTCASAHPQAIQKAIERYRYYIQSTAYTSALEKIEPKLVGRVDFRWLFIEFKEPYVVVPCEPAGNMRRIGEACWSQAVNTWAHCLATNAWPAYSRPGEVLRIEASPWALERAMESEDEGEVAA